MWARDDHLTWARGIELPEAGRGSAALLARVYRLMLMRFKRVAKRKAACEPLSGGRLASRADARRVGYLVEVPHCGRAPMCFRLMRGQCGWRGNRPQMRGLAGARLVSRGSWLPMQQTAGVPRNGRASTTSRRRVSGRRNGRVWVRRPGIAQLLVYTLSGCPGGMPSVRRAAGARLSSRAEARLIILLFTA